MSSGKDVVEKITIDGNTLEFVTRKGNTYLKKEMELTDSKKNDPEHVKLPDVIVVTRKDGLILFVLRAPSEGLKFVTAQTLYDKYQYQWFEPLADNYRELIYLNTKEYTKDAYKHFTWKQIDEFASVDRMSLSFAKGMPGDWKVSSQGGAGYLLVMIDGMPYWTDAVGQIPFAVDTYRTYRSIAEVVDTGIKWGPGTPTGRVTGDFDYSNTYDNYFVLRGALYAEQKYKYVTVKNESGTYPAARLIERVMAVNPNKLADKITPAEAKIYASWKK